MLNSYLVSCSYDAIQHYLKRSPLVFMLPDFRLHQRVILHHASRHHAAADSTNSPAISIAQAAILPEMWISAPCASAHWCEGRQIQSVWGGLSNQPDEHMGNHNVLLHHINPCTSCQPKQQYARSTSISMPLHEHGPCWSSCCCYSMGKMPHTLSVLPLKATHGVNLASCKVVWLLHDQIVSRDSNDNGTLGYRLPQMLLCSATAAAVANWSCLSNPQV